MSTDSIPATCPELGIEVPIGSIEKELRKLWEQDDAQTNASLMNFAVYSERCGGLLENSRIVRELTREHACRALLIEIDRTVTDPTLRAWITAHCHLAQGRKSVCCEQVAFRLTGRVTGRFRNTVFAHLNSDLPLVFWWQGELSDVFTERLVAVIDRLIIDSTCWSDVKGSFDTIVANSERNPDLIIQDLAWTRTWQYRVGIAGLFDDPIAQAALPEMNAVEILHHPKHRNSALQILAWLSVQAGWALTGQENEIFRFIKGDAAITATLVGDESSHAVGKVEIRSSNVSVKVTRDPSNGHLTREIDAPHYHATSLSPCDPDSSSELIALQLSRGGKNSLYQKILPRFRELI